MNMNLFPNRPNRLRTLKILLVAATGLALFLWLAYTPPGLLGKADAVGYAVCHRITERSFMIGDRQVPLCARCSGMYLGALTGMVYLARKGRKGGLPPLKISIVLGVFLFAFALDGGNSYLHFFPQAPGLYNPQNWLRLATGTGIGLGIAALLVPVVHQTLWQQYDPQPALGGWRQFLPLVGMAIVVDILLLSGNPLLLYPLALMSAGSVVLILTLVYTMVWTLATRQDNRFQSYRQIWMLLVAGFLTALLQVAVIDVGRYLFTGTWNGFNL
jgi:uncharacterized membrane protein